MRLRDEMVKAGTPAHVAEMNAVLFTEYARAYADRYGLAPVAEMKRITVERGRPGEGDGYFQPKTEAQLKFDTLTPFEVSSDVVLPLREGDGFMERVAGWLKENWLLGSYTNTDTGMNNILFDEPSVKRVIAHGARDGKIALLQVVPDMIQNGVYLETTHENTPLKRHIFASRAVVDGAPSVIGFVVREDVNGRRYYDHSLTELSRLDSPRKIGSENNQGADTHGAASSLPSRQGRVPTANRESISNIVHKHLGVKPDLTLNQRGARGAVELSPERAAIRLFEKADLSTIPHEGRFQHRRGGNKDSHVL